MMRLVICVFVLTTGALCALAVSTKSPAKPAPETDVITVFLTGNELGQLQPCGCSGGQLGGLDRRSALLAGVPVQRRLIVDTGLLVEEASEQNLIKFNIIIQALSLLDYDLVSLTEKDVEIAQNLGLLDSIGSVFNIISSHSTADVNVPAKFTKQFLLRQETVAVTVAAFDAESRPIEQISELFGPRANLHSVNILILNTRDAGAIEKIVKMGIVDCFIVPAESDEPEVISAPLKEPLILSVGRLGKYVGRLQIRTKQRGGKLTLGFSAVPVTENLPQAESLVELYKAYQQIVKEANLLEKQPRFALSNGLEYAGSKSCRPCHEYEYEKWDGTAHAHAYTTLEKVGSAFDPECVSCHVVGAEYESGFISEQKNGYLKNVGCESCHGPGSEHIKTQGEVETAEPRLDCADCHTTEQSANYAGNEQFYLEKIIHWREPNAAVDVKEKGEIKD